MKSNAPPRLRAASGATLPAGRMIRTVGRWAEFAENAIRKDFLPSEIDAIRRALEPMVATPHGGDRSKVETFHLVGREPGKTRDKIGAFAGVSGRTVEKIKAVVEAAEAEPEN